MTGAKIDVLEVEKLTLTNDGRGIIIYNQGDDNISRDWLGGSCSGNRSATSTTKGHPQFLYAASSSGWLKLTVISGNAANGTYYVPVFSNVDTNAST